jgi:hypothetical protein
VRFCLYSETNALVALSVPELSLAVVTTYPTTINMLGMPDQNFVNCLAIMAQRFSWSGINIVCGDSPDVLYPEYLCNLFDEGWRKSVSRNLPYDRYDLKPETAGSGKLSSPTDFIDILANISNRRGQILSLNDISWLNFL